MNKIIQKTHRPIQYQRGYVEFYKLRFKLTEDVLIPRPETELLVDDVLNFVSSNSSLVHSSTTELTSNQQPANEITILDIGTGSGNIAISIAKNLKFHPPGGTSVKIIATEVSGKALKIAKQNAKLHGVENQIEFIESDLLDNFQISNLKSQIIIVTNLPYIPSARIPYLDASVVDFEPHVALDGGDDGFGLYRKLFAQIKETGLKPNLILGEIDYTHGDIAKTEAEKYFPDAKVEVKTDLAHKQRILFIKT